MDWNLITNVTLAIMYLTLTFGIGYVVGIWRNVDYYENKLEDMLIDHVQEIDSIKKKLDGEEWKL